MKKINKKGGFTLIEILVVIGLIAILATVVLVAVNPAKQFRQARNSQRVANVNAILNAIGQNLADNKGEFQCSDSIPSSDTEIGKDELDLRPCLVPDYLSELPVDPQDGANTCESPSACLTGDYNTGYEVRQEASGRITVSAPSAEDDETIEVTR